MTTTAEMEQLAAQMQAGQLKVTFVPGSGDNETQQPPTAFTEFNGVRYPVALASNGDPVAVQFPVADYEQPNGETIYSSAFVPINPDGSVGAINWNRAERGNNNLANFIDNAAALAAVVIAAYAAAPYLASAGTTETAATAAFAESGAGGAVTAGTGELTAAEIAAAAYSPTSASGALQVAELGSGATITDVGAGVYGVGGQGATDAVTAGAYDAGGFDYGVSAGADAGTGAVDLSTTDLGIGQATGPTSSAPANSPSWLSESWNSLPPGVRNYVTNLASKTGGALTTAALASLFGNSSSSDAQRNIAAQQAELARQQALQAADNRARYTALYSPLEQRLIQEATAGNTPDYAGIESRTMADYSKAFSNLADQRARAYDPYGEGRTGFDSATRTAVGLPQLANGINQARINERNRIEELNFRQRAALLAGGQSLVGASNNGLGSAIAGLGNAASTYNIVQQRDDRALTGAGTAGGYFGNVGGNVPAATNYVDEYGVVRRGTPTQQTGGSL